MHRRSWQRSGLGVLSQSHCRSPPSWPLMLTLAVFLWLCTGGSVMAPRVHPINLANLRPVRHRAFTGGHALRDPVCGVAVLAAGFLARHAATLERVGSR